jgi:hypothetical protein
MEELAGGVLIIWTVTFFSSVPFTVIGMIEQDALMITVSIITAIVSGCTTASMFYLMKENNQ